MKIGFIGAGQMAEAIFSGLLRSEIFKSDEVYLTDISKPRLDLMKEKHGVSNIFIADDDGYEKVIADCDLIMFSIKPQFASDLLAKIGTKFRKEQTVVSIMGGVPLSFLEEKIHNSKIVRVMPNTPMLVNEGASGIALGRGCGDAEGNLMKKLFSAVGTCYILPESLIDPLTGVSGAGPAYCYMFIEALADGGVKMGLPRQMAMELAAQTLIGSAKMVLETGEHPGKLKDNVCSPGGGTIAGVYALEKGAFRATVIDAVEGCITRMREVGKNA